jgi:hypothetical protein
MFLQRLYTVKPELALGLLTRRVLRHASYQAIETGESYEISVGYAGLYDVNWKA